MAVKSIVIWLSGMGLHQYNHSIEFINSLAPGSSIVISNWSFSNLYQGQIFWAFPVELPSNDATRPYWWSVNIGSGDGLVPAPSHYLSQCWYRSMASLDHKELIMSAKSLGKWTLICFFFRKLRHFPDKLITKHVLWQDTTSRDPPFLPLVILKNEQNFLNLMVQHCISILVLSMLTDINRADSRSAPSQWETAILCNDVSYWPGASLESALIKNKWFHLWPYWGSIVQGHWMDIHVLIKSVSKSSACGLVMLWHQRSWPSLVPYWLLVCFNGRIHCVTGSSGYMGKYIVLLDPQVTWANTLCYWILRLHGRIHCVTGSSGYMGKYIVLLDPQVTWANTLCYWILRLHGQIHCVAGSSGYMGKYIVLLDHQVTWANTLCYWIIRLHGRIIVLLDHLVIWVYLLRTLMM